MPTDKIERRITFTPNDVLEALTNTFPDLIPSREALIQAKVRGDGLFMKQGSDYKDIISTERGLESLTLLYYLDGDNES